MELRSRGSQGGGVYVTYGARGSQGGGVYVTSGVANFEGCNIHDNAAEYVCACIFKLS